MDSDFGFRPQTFLSPSRPKIWQNSIIFYPIFTFLILNFLFLRDKSNGVQIKALSLLVKILVFGPIFAPKRKRCEP